LVSNAKSTGNRRKFETSSSIDSSRRGRDGEQRVVDERETGTASSRERRRGNRGGRTRGRRRNRERGSDERRREIGGAGPTRGGEGTASRSTRRDEKIASRFNERRRESGVLFRLTPDAAATCWQRRGTQHVQRGQVAFGVWAGQRGRSTRVATLRRVVTRRARGRELRFVRSPTPSSARGRRTERGLHRLGDGALNRVRAHANTRPGRDRAHATRWHLESGGCAVAAPSAPPGEIGFGRDLEVSRRRSGPARLPDGLVANGRRRTKHRVHAGWASRCSTSTASAAIEALNDRRRFGPGPRHITSRPPASSGIRRVTALEAGNHAGVSLHAARGPLRDVLVVEPRMAGRRGHRRGPRSRPCDRAPEQFTRSRLKAGSTTPRRSTRWTALLTGESCPRSTSSR